MSDVFYKHTFRLLAPLNDIRKADRYLNDVDMTGTLVSDLRYLGCGEDEIGRIKGIRWKITDADGGFVLLTATGELMPETLGRISEWVSGQNSDGLGSGFCDQEFARKPEGEYEYNAAFDSHDECLFTRVPNPEAAVESGHRVQRYGEFTKQF